MPLDLWLKQYRARKPSKPYVESLVQLDTTHCCRLYGQPSSPSRFIDVVDKMKKTHRDGHDSIHVAEAAPDHHHHHHHHHQKQRQQEAAVATTAAKLTWEGTSDDDIRGEYRNCHCLFGERHKLVSELQCKASYDSTGATC